MSNSESPFRWLEGLTPEQIAFWGEYKLRRELMESQGCHAHDGGPAHCVIDDDNLEDEDIDLAINGIKARRDTDHIEPFRLQAQLEMLQWLKSVPEATRIAWLSNR